MIKRSFLALPALLALTLPLPSLAAGTADEELMKLEQRMLDGVLAGDLSLFKRIAAPDYVFTTPEGRLQSVADLEADLKSGRFKLLASKNLDMKVRLHGETAVVTYRSLDKGQFDGQPFEGANRWTDVFVKRRGAWRLVASQGTPLPPEPAKP